MKTSIASEFRMHLQGVQAWHQAWDRDRIDNDLVLALRIPALKTVDINLSHVHVSITYATPSTLSSSFLNFNSWM